MTRAQGVIGALPIGAGAALLVARWLPLDFSYRENDLGIVSLATEMRYPQQQETFWLVLGVSVAAVCSWLLARRLERGLPAARRIAVEASAAAALLALLWLPPLAGTLVFCLGAAAALVLARTGGEAAVPADPDAWGVARPHGALLFVGCLAVGALVTRDLGANLWSVAAGFSDADRIIDGFPFMGEAGQHLAWANALRHGRYHGADFFCLYGPLYDLGLVAMWELLGRSIAVWDLYSTASRALGIAALMTLTGLLLRHRLLALLLPFLVTWISLRLGIPLVGLALLLTWLRDGRGGFAAAAGVAAGTALLYSQEFGLAFTLVALVAFAATRATGAAALFGLGAAAVIAPLFLWYGANDALLPMLRDVVAYPGYVVAGYAKLPFPALASHEPLLSVDFHTRELLAYKFGYGTPAICLGALLLALPISRLDPRHPIASLGRIVDGLRAEPLRAGVVLLALFGLLTFRSALGRSDIKHMTDTIPAAAALLVVGLDRIATAWRSGTLGGSLATWRIVALAGVLAHAGYAELPRPLSVATHNFETTRALIQRGRRPVTDPDVLGVVRWVWLNTEAGESVLFLPNNGAYYYLTDRPNPIRFVMGHQIVTEAHRREVLDTLRADPPRVLVWDDAAMRIDGLSDEKVFGAELMAWLESSYGEVERFGDVSIRLHRGAPES